MDIVELAAVDRESVKLSRGTGRGMLHGDGE